MALMSCNAYYTVALQPHLQSEATARSVLPVLRIQPTKLQCLYTLAVQEFIIIMIIIIIIIVVIPTSRPLPSLKMRQCAVYASMCENASRHPVWPCLCCGLCKQASCVAEQ